MYRNSTEISVTMNLKIPPGKLTPYGFGFGNFGVVGQREVHTPFNPNVLRKKASLKLLFNRNIDFSSWWEDCEKFRFCSDSKFEIELV